MMLSRKIAFIFLVISGVNGIAIAMDDLREKDKASSFNVQALIGKKSLLNRLDPLSAGSALSNALVLPFYAATTFLLILSQSSSVYSLEIIPPLLAIAYVFKDSELLGKMSLAANAVMMTYFCSTRASLVNDFNNFYFLLPPILAMLHAFRSK